MSFFLSGVNTQVVIRSVEVNIILSWRFSNVYLDQISFITPVAYKDNNYQIHLVCFPG